MATADGNGSTADWGAARPAWWPWLPLQWHLQAPEKLTQPINPGWSFGNVVNVTHLNSSAPDIERDVLQKHSYGRQIGRVMDAVSALVEQLPASVKRDERVTEFVALAEEVARIKDNARLPRLERIRKDIEALKQEDPHAYQQLRRMLGR